MASYVPVVKNGANGAILYVSLVSQANTKVMQGTPTLASGDFKVSIDGGALANLGTLPTNTPASSTMVKITLSQGEVNGDNITVVCSDAAGAEWCDLTINVQTVARQIDDLAYPTVSGRSLDVSATGEAGVDWANVGSPTTTNGLTGTTIATSQVVASVTGSVGSVVGAVGSVTGLTAANLDVAVSTRLATAGYTAPPSAAAINAEVVDALATDTYAEPGQAAPAATASLAAKIGLLYKDLRNKKTQSATEQKLYDDAGTTVDQKRTVGDDGVTTTRAELEAGP